LRECLFGEFCGGLGELSVVALAEELDEVLDLGHLSGGELRIFRMRLSSRAACLVTILS